MRDKALLAATDALSWLDRADFPAFRGDRRGLRGTLAIRTGTPAQNPAYYASSSGLAAVPMAQRRARDRVGIGMYSFVYWTGVMTLLVWSAYSAYSAFIG
jgi:hypothetical protein